MPSYAYGDRALTRTAFPIFGRSTQEPQLAANTACTGSGCQTAVMLRPVPLGATAGAANATSTEAGSTWNPVQRVGGESASPTTDNSITPAVTLERPTASGNLVGMQTPLGGPLMPVPPAPVASIVLDDKTADKKGAGEDGKKETTLPKPKLLPPGKHGAANGYPDLPAAVITQPVKAPGEFRMHALSAYVVEPPDILLVEVDASVASPGRLRGELLVRPDGTIGFSTYPAIFVAGLTLDQIKTRLAEVIFERVSKDKTKDFTLKDVLHGLRVDVLRYNSKFYYVITDGGGYGEPVIRFPLTGNERVLDAVAQIQGLPAVASKKHIWIARATPNDHQPPMILPVDWCAISQGGKATTNYQLFPGDRLYVKSDPWIQGDSWLAKRLAPIERVLGATLLGASTYNTIRQGGRSGSGNNNTGSNLVR